MTVPNMPYKHVIFFWLLLWSCFDGKK